MFQYVYQQNHVQRRCLGTFQIIINLVLLHFRNAQPLRQLNLLRRNIDPRYMLIPGFLQEIQESAVAAAQIDNPRILIRRDVFRDYQANRRSAREPNA